MSRPQPSVVRLTKRALALVPRCWPLAMLLVVGGCASGRQPPPDLAHVRLELVDSPQVRVSQAWLERKEGPLRLRGHVLRRPETEDTTGTHLDISWLDANGALLRSTREHFEPRQIPRRPRMPDSADFTIPLAQWPTETRTIVIRAHEGEHP